MKWYKPTHGSTKIRSWFALFPVRIDNEVRWFEKVTVKYSYDGIREKWRPYLFVDGGNQLV